MCCPQRPPFRLFFASGASSFQPLLHPQGPHLYIYLMHFQAQITLIFVKFQLLRPRFQQTFFHKTLVISNKIHCRDPTFEDLGGTYLLKRYLSTPGCIYYICMQHMKAKEMTPRYLCYLSGFFLFSCINLVL